MKYSEINKITDKIKESIKEINEYDNVDDFVNRNYQLYLRNGEPDDNTLDTSDYYRILKDIEADPNFESKLKFILSNFI